METHIHNEPSGDSSASAVLLAIIVILVAGFLVWYFGYHRPNIQPTSPGVNVQLNLPSTPSGNGTSGGTGTGGSAY